MNINYKTLTYVASKKYAHQLLIAYVRSWKLFQKMFNLDMITNIPLELISYIDMKNMHQ
jgi:hypothetical protein